MRGEIEAIATLSAQVMPAIVRGYVGSAFLRDGVNQETITACSRRAW